MIAEHACVVTTVPKHGFPSQTHGVIVSIYGAHEAYEVELFGSSGETLSVETYEAGEVVQRHPDFDHSRLASLAGSIGGPNM